LLLPAVAVAVLVVTHLAVAEAVQVVIELHLVFPSQRVQQLQ
jgi:hypothetical protein